ncbi:MAG: hypothetical protein EOO02_06660, partial [Chitinophagaceae bacterium]
MKKLNSLIMVASMLLVFASCKKDDPPLAPNQVNFEAREQGLAAESAEAEVKISLSRPAETAIPLTVELLASGVTYGTEFTTTPEAVSNQITLTIAAGANSTSFKLLKKSGFYFSGSESVGFVIKGIPATAVAGDVDTATVKFSAIVSTGSQLTLQGKTTESNYANVVYVDLSNNQPTAVSRKSWNLGFYNGAGFRVILNQSYQSTIKVIDKTDINSVGYADTTGVYLDHNLLDPSTAALVDNWTGDISKTAIAEISATDTENKVYLLSFEANKAQALYYKVKITRSGSGYRLQYAKIGETTIKTLEVPKGSTANFQFASVESGQLVTVEPKKESWDLQWCYGTYDSGLGSPYWFQDLVLINNLGGAKAAEVMETTVTYDAFAEANISAVTFSTNRDAIGSKWRQGGSQSGPGTIKRDRFYVIQDPNGNVYKLKFISWGGGGD